MRGRPLATFGILAGLLGIGLFLFIRHNSQPSESQPMLQAFLTALNTAGPADSVERQYLEATDGTGLPITRIFRTGHRWLNCFSIMAGERIVPQAIFI